MGGYRGGSPPGPSDVPPYRIYFFIRWSYEKVLINRLPAKRRWVPPTGSPRFPTEYVFSCCDFCVCQFVHCQFVNLSICQFVNLSLFAFAHCQFVDLSIVDLSLFAFVSLPIVDLSIGPRRNRLGPPKGPIGSSGRKIVFPIAHFWLCVVCAVNVGSPQAGARICAVYHITQCADCPLAY